MASPGAEGPRLSRAVVDLGGDILRNALYHHFTPALAHAEVLLLRRNPRHPLSRLNVQQMSVLNKAVTRGDYSECDITLLYSLIRNLPLTNAALRPTAGWGKLPVNSANKTLGDDIERIREMRNQMYGHIASTTISVVIYTQYMAELYDICLRKDTTHAASLRSPTPRSNTYCQTLADIQVVCMDPATEKRYTDEIRRMEKSDKEIRDQIDDVQRDLSGVKTNFGHLKTDMGTLQSEQETLGGRLEALEGATASVDEVRKDVNTLRSGQEKLGGRLDAVEGTAASKDKVRKITETLRSGQKDLGKRLESVEGVKPTVSRMQIDVDTLQSEQETLGGRLEAVEDTASRVDAELTSMKTEQEDITSHVDTIDRELTSVKTAIRSQQTAAANLQITNEDVEGIQGRLIKRHDKSADHVQVMPLNEIEVLPIQAIYGEMVLQEDLTAMKKTRKGDEPTGNKTLTCTADIFCDVRELKRVFVTGEAGHGKTVFSLKLLKVWANGKRTNLNRGQQSQSSPLQNTEDEARLIQCLSVYKLVFHVPLRDAESLPEGSSVVDLVCDNMPECDQNDKEKIKLMLGDRDIPCLIILDGLDEYKLPSVSRVKGFLERGLVNTVVLCTMRPWRMVNLELKLDGDHDKVVQICSLKEESIEQVFNSILHNFYGVPEDSVTYRNVKKKLYDHSRFPHVKSLIKIPLYLTLCCRVWYEEFKGDVTESDSGDDQSVESSSFFITCLYLKLFSLKFERAEKKYDDVNEYVDEKLENPPTLQNTPDLLSEYFGSMIDFFEVIEPIGKLFFESLLKETRLVFPKRKLRRDIKPRILDFALQLGIFSQTKSPCSSHEEMVSVNMHISIREFIAALYVACKGESAYKLFCEHCCTVDKVMKLSNMIMFVCGLDPVVGCRLSEHVKNVVNSDAVITQYREGRKLQYSKMGWKVKQQGLKVLHKIHFKWYREMKNNLSYTQKTNPELDLNATDLHLDEDVDHEEMNMVKKLVSMEGNSIVSVYLDEMKIRSVHLRIVQNLPNCKNLTSLFIRDSPLESEQLQNVEMLAKVLPQLKHLKHVAYIYPVPMWWEFYERYFSSKQMDAGDLFHGTYLTLSSILFISESFVTGNSHIHKIMHDHLLIVSDVLRSAMQLPSLKCMEFDGLKIKGDSLSQDCIEQLETVVLHRVINVHFILSPLSHCRQLKYIELANIFFDDTVVLAGMPVLQTVVLRDVQNVHGFLPLLPKCPRLETLHLLLKSSEDVTKTCKVLCEVLPRLDNLQRIYYQGNGSADVWHYNLDAVGILFQQLQQLRDIMLESICLQDETNDDDKCGQVVTHLQEDDDDPLAVGPLALLFGDNEFGPVVKPHMTKLENVGMFTVQMPAWRWLKFVSSLLNVKQPVHVELKYTDIDEDTLDMVNNSESYTIQPYTMVPSDYLVYTPNMTSFEYPSWSTSPFVQFETVPQVV